jgi:undecaprenyl-diphosphatase
VRFRPDVCVDAFDPWQRLAIRSGEWRWCAAANRWAARRTIAALFKLVSRLGDGVFWYALMAVLCVAGYHHAAIHMGVTGLAATALYRHLKRWTRRPRPFRAHAGIVARMPPLDEFSFPSGHTLHAVVFTLVALAHAPWLAPLLAPFTVLVGMSRVVLGLHYPSDVLAATLIGSGLAGLSLWFVPGASLFA